MKNIIIVYVSMLLCSYGLLSPVPTDPVAVVTGATDPLKIAKTATVAASNPITKTTENAAKTEMTSLVNPMLADTKGCDSNSMKHVLTGLTGDTGISRELITAGMEHLMPHEFSFIDEANRVGDAAVGVATGFDTAVHAITHIGQGFPFLR